MNVGQLIKELQWLDPKRVVILQKDSEGNGYSPLASLWTGKYRAETTWHGEAGMEQLTQQDIDAGFSDLDVMTDGDPAVILTPVN